MIHRLYIKNYALIDQLDIRFSGNLTGITGETGAGKSIILGALGLVMGNRADTRVLYNTEEKCVVEAYFNIKAYDLKDFFEENDLDYDHEVVIRREITPAGKSRAFINDTPAVLEVVQKLSDALLDLHNQFDTMDVYDMSFQMRVIDALAGTQELVKNYREQFRKYKSTRSKLEQMRADSLRAAQEADFLRFQLEELQQAEWMEGEQAQLEQEIASLTNAEDIKRAAGASFQGLTEAEDTVVSRLEEMIQLLRPVAKYHPSLPKLQERLESAVYELQDVSSEMENIAEGTDYDPKRIQEVQGRLALLYKLLKKHNVAALEDLLALQDEFEQRLKGFSNTEEQIVALEIEVSKKEKELHTLGAAISEKRVKVVPSFEKSVHERLAQVSMEHARLQVELTPAGELFPSGTDKLRFLFAANRGSRMEEIKGTASGGELSRLAFVIKSLVAAAIPLPTIIFDEIDSGVSGDVAMQMGVILRQLSDGHQVVVITHSPQVAAKAQAHYFVYKRALPDRTVTEIRQLTADERVFEISKMLSGNPPTEAAKQNAKELLGV